MPILKTLEIALHGTTDSSVIWLHGLGADAHDFEPVVRELHLPNTRFILPNAPLRAVTMNNGYVMPAWYDIFGLAAASRQDESGIRTMQQQLDLLIAQEIRRGVAAERIVLAGFSQGGAMALHTALRYPARLAGVLALSTYLPLKNLLAAEASPANAALPVFMAHGRFDTVISPSVAQAAAEVLRAAGYPLIWHEYAMAHSVCMEEIADIRKVLVEWLGAV